MVEVGTVHNRSEDPKDEGLEVTERTDGLVTSVLGILKFMIFELRIPPRSVAADVDPRLWAFCNKAVDINERSGADVDDLESGPMTSADVLVVAATRLLAGSEELKSVTRPGEAEGEAWLASAFRA